MGLPWWAAVLGLMAGTFGIGWAIVKAYATHNWRTCQCVDCRKRRYHAHKNQGHHAVGVTPDGDVIWSEDPPRWGKGATPGALDVTWLSTAELEPRMVVFVRNVPYRVMEIRTDTKGYLVMLNVLTGPDRRKQVIVTVIWGNGNRKYWETR